MAPDPGAASQERKNIFPPFNSEPEWQGGWRIRYGERTRERDTCTGPGDAGCQPAQIGDGTDRASVCLLIQEEFMAYNEKLAERIRPI
jgi:hypothetical protein